MSVTDRISPALRAQARTLDDLGLVDIAWSREHAREVLNAIRARDIAILGGDVYREQGGQLEHTYDNWHCERLPEESLAQYARRSWQHTWEYVARYPDNKAQKVFFRLVMSDEPTAGL
jgi:hypothetical protein